MSNRDEQGRFTQGHQIARLGWAGLVQRRFGGDEATCKAWWGAMGAWHYDAPYRAKGWGAVPFPGSPEQFCQRMNQRLDFTLADVSELAF